jgi:hypothetical protein
MARLVIGKISDALQSRTFPSVTLWNRLEGRPRTENFSRALRAEIRDALWMITRQWQMGEYQGDDAGSPVFAKVHIATTGLTKLKAGPDAPATLDAQLPLEAAVEQRGIPFTLDIRLLMGRQWLKMIASIADYSQAFITQYPIAQPDPTRKEDAAVCAHKEAWASFVAVSGRMMDGAGLYSYLKGGANRHAYDGINVNPAHHDPIDTAAGAFIAWFEKLYYAPGKNDAWEPDRFEYQFSCSAPQGTGESVLVSEEYYQGHLDWYNLDVDTGSAGLGGAAGAPDPRGTQTFTVLPSQVSFDGMPNTRWWAFEDGRTNFGDIKPDTTDLAKLLLMEFGLVFANDWFLIPFTLPSGSIARIRGMAVTNVFGERTWIEGAGTGADDTWQRWTMFTINTVKPGGAPDNSLLLLPASLKTMEGPPLEEAMLVRDEMANMVWGIERTIPLPSGGGKLGSEAAIETLSYFRRLLPQSGAGTTPGLIPNDAAVQYQIMSSMPENWIPFVPVHVPNDTRETQLQRAAMLRILDGDPADPVPVQPRTSLLRQGLDQAKPASYFVHEEEVPRAGVRATLSFRRARSRNGRACVWLGFRKQSGRGEASSGLAFDRIVDVRPRSA